MHRYIETHFILITELQSIMKQQRHLMVCFNTVQFSKSASKHEHNMCG